MASKHMMIPKCEDGNAVWRKAVTAPPPRRRSCPLQGPKMAAAAARHRSCDRRALQGTKTRTENLRWAVVEEAAVAGVLTSAADSATIETGKKKKKKKKKKKHARLLKKKKTHTKKKKEIISHSTQVQKNT
eukprot:NODE_24564_length_620_cov_1.892495.p2 GENE.NODE_24564_length_620_cov_1.892495~~NODE_24564_length_620_cov_1.892495.p2  ORF type:complete len:131 (-),score=39.92 NODE_24564_length_620_cov_1.892495:4-396(-)